MKARQLRGWMPARNGTGGRRPAIGVPEGGAPARAARNAPGAGDRSRRDRPAPTLPSKTAAHHRVRAPRSGISRPAAAFPRSRRGSPPARLRPAPCLPRCRRRPASRDRHARPPPAPPARAMCASDRACPRSRCRSAPAPASAGNRHGAPGAAAAPSPNPGAPSSGPRLASASPDRRRTAPPPRTGATCISVNRFSLPNQPLPITPTR